MIRKLRHRLVILEMCIFMIMLIVIFSMVLTLTRQRFRSSSEQIMQGLLNSPYTPSESSAAGSDENSKTSADFQDEMETNASAIPFRDRIRIPYTRITAKADGSSASASVNTLKIPDEDLSYFVRQVVLLKQRSGVMGEFGLCYLIDFKEPDAENVPPLGIRKKDAEIPQDAEITLILMDNSMEESTMKRLFETCLLIGVISFVVFLIISIFFARWLSRPVDEAWKQQRQFVSDASHELKTPLTVILTDAELLKENVDNARKKQASIPVAASLCQPEAAELAKAGKNISFFSDNILEMAEQMRGLVEELLQLARIDSGAIQQMTLSDLDFSRLTENELLTFEALFYEKGLKLESDITPGILVHGSGQHLKQVLSILLDNALKYASCSGTVRVTLRKADARKLELSVADPGDPISPEDLKNIFKRFYRIDEARAMNHSYGLGLSIAEDIVTQHAGTIRAESRNGINTFIVELPLSRGDLFKKQ